MRDHTGARRGHKTVSLTATQWRLADEVVALGETLRVADRPLDVADALLVLAMRACRELSEVMGKTASFSHGMRSSTER